MVWRRKDGGEREGNIGKSECGVWRWNVVEVVVVVETGPTVPKTHSSVCLVGGVDVGGEGRGSGRM